MEAATVRVSSETKVTVSYILPIIDWLLSHDFQPKDDDANVKKEPEKQCPSDLNKRYQGMRDVCCCWRQPWIPDLKIYSGFNSKTKVYKQLKVEMLEAKSHHYHLK